MLEALNGNNFQYTKLSPEEAKERGILGILYGVVADTKKPTRNGRLYPREAWEKALNDDLFQEQLQNKAILGELEHPDREDIDPREACVALASTPKIGNDGLLYGEFHILDLPNGRILKTLCDYGTTVGVSSRGNGDLEEDINGDASVVPDSFDLTCWDVVLTPAVKAARQNYVRESLEHKKSLQESLKDLVSQSKDSDKKIMEKTINEIKEKLNEDINVSNNDNNKNTLVENNTDNNIVANDNGTSQIVKSLTEALKDKSNLENEIKKLQEQLAVRDSEVNKLKEGLDKYKSSTSRLSTIVVKGKELEKENSQLKESIATKDEEIKSLKAKALKLIEMKNETSKQTNSLNESLTNKDNDIKELQEKLNTQTKQSENEINTLKESLDKQNKQIESLNKEVTKKTKLVQSYRELANNIVESYIKSKALMIGAQPEEIKNKLPDKYTLNDIDRICENLQSYSIRMGKLPFDLKSDKVQIEVKAPVTESINRGKKVDNPDEVDEDLIRLAQYHQQEKN
jgi:hypothetical protein